MDENERAIARILEEEANAMEAQNIAAGGVDDHRPHEAPPVDESGVRAPDEARYQAMIGPEADYDAEADRRYLLE